MTTRHVSLLRGINVGGHNLVSMARLRALYEALGCEDVATYLQSGNVVFRRDRDPAGVGRGVERAIKRELGLDIRVLDRTHADLAAIVEADPFPKADPSRRVVMFLAGPPGTEIAREIEHVTLGPDEARLIGREVHLHCPDGIGNSKLPGLLSERRLGVTATARNWRTVSRLFELSGDQS
jgi:uncharacterized protein (DUF1697 family)